MTIEKLDASTPDLTRQNIERLLELFPECRTEGSRQDAPSVDFDLLRQALSDSLVEGPAERYRLDWPGKRKALLTANTPIDKTLRPMREESVDFDTTRNLFIEGDNLDALKLLQETYLGKIKMIYIDPPYNTGNDFVYHDNFAQSQADYDLESGQVDDRIGRLVANPETNGRFHSNWLNMIYPRLKLAKNMLSDDGIIFISIGDDEVFNLQEVCDEVFGIDNFLGNACRVSKKANNQGDYWSPNFDYVLTYAKSKAHCPVFFGGVNYKAYKEVDAEGPRAGEKYQLVRLYMTSLDPLRGCTNQRYFIEAPDGTLLIPPGSVFPEEKKDGAKVVPERSEDKVWRWSQQAYLEKKDEICVKAVRSSNLVDQNGDEVLWNVFTKTYLNDVIAKSSSKPNSLIEEHINQNSSHELKALGIPFPHAKPSSLIEFLCEISKVGENDIVMDFFAGSGSSAHGVFRYNLKSGSKTRSISVQLPEELDPEDKDQKAAWHLCEELGLSKTVASISRERIRRAGSKISNEGGKLTGKLDTGFRAFRIDSGNAVDTSVTPKEATQEALAGMVSHIKDDRSEEDLLFGALLRWGVDITLPIEQSELAGRKVWLVDAPEDGKGKGGALIACFAKPGSSGKGGIDTELADAMAELAPLRVLFRDDGFADDATKENVHSRFKQLAPDTQVRVL